MFRSTRRPGSRSTVSRPSRRARGESVRLLEALEGRRMLAADTLPVLIGGAAAKSVQFVDANGTKAVVHLLGPGSATVNFAGTGLAQGSAPAGVSVSGSDVSVDSIALSGTGLNTTLQITTLGRTPVSIGGITSSGVMAAIKAPGVALTGDLTTGGWVHQVTLGSATGGTIDIGPSHINGGLGLSVGSATDENLVSAIRINNLTAGQWTSSGGAGTESITAPQILTIHVRGTFDPDLTVSGIAGAQVALQTASVGVITAGTWTVNGHSHILQANTIASGWSATVTGGVDRVNVLGDATMNFTAPLVGNFAVHGTLSDSTISLTAPLTATGYDLNQLFVGGAMVNTTVTSPGSINMVSAGSMQDSAVYVGLNGAALPTSTSEFANTARIRTVALRTSAAGASFSGSNVAAYELDNVNLGSVNTSNGGTPFGVAAHAIRSITLSDRATGHHAHAVNVPTTGAFAALLASKGIAQNDFVGEIV